MIHNQPSPVLVMIVDDQLQVDVGDDDRKLTYEKWLAQISDFHRGKWSFDVHYCETLDDVAKIVITAGQPVLAIIDMVLEGSKWSSRSVEQLDRKLISEDWPMILVSARFDSNKAIERANRLVGATPDRAPFQFLTWSAISRAVDGVEQSEVAFIVGAVLSLSRGQDMRFAKRPDDTIEILHITDPHFGKATWDVGSLISLRLAREKVGLHIADFLAITGDIADTGTPAQYQLAFDYFEALANNRVMVSTDTGLPRDRVFICPGNHDFSRPLALAANLANNPPYVVGDTMLQENAWIRSFAWAPYQEFERRITEHSQSWILSPGYRINTRFASSGLIILELNVERYAIDGYQPGISDVDLRKTINAAVTAVEVVRENSECLLVLAHRHESNIWQALSQTIQSNLQGLAGSGPLIFICGHEHSAEVSPGLKERALFVRGASPNPGPKLPTLVLPMVNCIRLLRRGGVMTGVEVHQFHQQAAGWQMDVDGPRRYGYRNGKWQANVD